MSDKEWDNDYKLIKNEGPIWRHYKGLENEYEEDIKESWIDWTYIEWEKYINDLISQFVEDLRKSKGMKVFQLLNWRDGILKKWEKIKTKEGLG